MTAVIEIECDRCQLMIRPGMNVVLSEFGWIHDTCEIEE